MTTTMPRPRRPPFHRVALAASAFVLIFIGFSIGPARADLLSPCSSLEDGIICAATDVGKPCQGGGACLAMTCYNSTQTTSHQGMVYLCIACPQIVSVPTGTCTANNMGTACSGDGGAGTCGITPPACRTTGVDGYSCQTATTARPTGPPAGEGSSSGCDVVPKPTKPTTIGLGLIGIGLAVFFIDRARRRR